MYVRADILVDFDVVVVAHHKVAVRILDYLLAFLILALDGGIVGDDLGHLDAAVEYVRPQHTDDQRRVVHFLPASKPGQSSATPD